MANLPKVEIKCSAPNMAEIYIDGHKLPAVRNIAAYMPLDEVPYVKVEIITTDLTIDGIGELEITAKEVVADERFLSGVARRVASLLKYGNTYRL